MPLQKKTLKKSILVKFQKNAQIDTLIVVEILKYLDNVNKKNGDLQVALELDNLSIHLFSKIK